jgi:hypothetical protein
MRVQVSQTTLKRLEKLDAPLRAEHNRGAFVLALHHGIPMPPGSATYAQRTVLSWPRIAADLDAWERESSKSQDALIASSAEDRYKPEAHVVIEDDTAARNAAENERLYQESRKAAAEGGLSLVRANERRVLRTTH